ncbi:MAG: DUF3617 family protein [Alphaproteobacteria bacterium]
MRLRFRHTAILACILFSALPAVARAQTSVPLLEPKPVFVPGLYETEARNSAFKNHPVTSKTCVASADYDAFRDETMKAYNSADNIKVGCTLSETKTIKNGFAFAMQCKGSKQVLTYEFGKDGDGKELVRGTIQTFMQAAPKYSSSILIMMRRVGDCPGQTPAKAL